MFSVIALSIPSEPRNLWINYYEGTPGRTKSEMFRFAQHDRRKKAGLKANSHPPEQKGDHLAAGIFLKKRLHVQ